MYYCVANLYMSFPVPMSLKESADISQGTSCTPMYYTTILSCPKVPMGQYRHTGYPKECRACPKVPMGQYRHIPRSPVHSLVLHYNPYVFSCPKVTMGQCRHIPRSPLHSHYSAYVFSCSKVPTAKGV